MGSNRFHLGVLWVAMLAFASMQSIANGGASDGEAGQALAERKFEYHDDADGRMIGDVRVVVRDTPAGPRLWLAISADGPLIEPAPGWRGVRGANRITAEQLGMLLNARTPFGVRTRSPSAGLEEAAAGKFWQARRGRLPIRSQRADGSIDFEASTPELALEMQVESAPLHNGTQYLELTVAGVPRLRVKAEIGDHTARIVEFESLSGKPHDSASQLVGAGPSGAPQPRRPSEVIPELKIDRADWDARDLEGKWVRYKQGVTQQGDDPRSWVQFLVGTKNDELLEWIAIYEPFGFDVNGVGHALTRLDTPRWARAMVWVAGNPFGHIKDASMQELTDGASFTLPWFEKYPEARTKALDELLANLNRTKHEKFDVSKMLPPLKPGEVLSLLDAPNDLAEWGDRKRAEPGKVYVHQVTRAIDGLLASGIRDEAWTNKLITLTNHPNEQVRIAAYLAFTHFDKQPEAIVRQSLDTAVNERESANVRVAAFMAYSYSGQPGVQAKLLLFASNAKLPLWRTAISRLADIGDEVTWKQLNTMQVANLMAVEDETFFEREKQRWRARLDEEMKQRH